MAKIIQQIRGDRLSWIIDEGKDPVTQPIIMGILNVTPDSFSDGGRYPSTELALVQARQMLEDGADIIDIGGESTRPGSLPVNETEEMRRVLPVIEALADDKSVLLSIDTRKSSVAEAAVKRGAVIVNDVSAGLHDENMFRIIADYQLKYIMMHMQGIPETMQLSPAYKHVINDIKIFFKDRIKDADNQGVSKEQIVLDPGIGFGKTLTDNLTIMANMDSFHELGCPLLLGASRKSFIAAIDESPVDQRLGGSIAAVLAAAARNVQIFRVHDVRETRQALNIFTAIQKHLD